MEFLEPTYDPIELDRITAEALADTETDQRARELVERTIETLNETLEILADE